MAYKLWFYISNDICVIKINKTKYQLSILGDLGFKRCHRSKIGLVSIKYVESSVCTLPAHQQNKSDHIYNDDTSAVFITLEN